MIPRAPFAVPRTAAFFDIDGTLLTSPSLERRLFGALRAQRAIPAQNYLRWFAHALRIAPRGIQEVLYANKMYLRGIEGAQLSGCAHPAMSFFPAAIDQAAWHAAHNHTIILVSGTLAPVAHRVALALTAKLATRGLAAPIGVCATQLEKIDNRYTGRVAGNAVFGPAKAEAIHRIAVEQSLDLCRCYAYGDTHQDRWMLAAVGRPTAVNPTKALERVARLHEWPVLRWTLSSPAQM